MESKDGKVRENNSLQQDNNFDVRKHHEGKTVGDNLEALQPMLTMEHSESEKEDDIDEDIELTEKTEQIHKLGTPTIIGEPSKDTTKSEEDSDVKPSHSYIALIAMAILSCANKKMILGDIYQFISDNYPYYRNKDKSWRNSIRHNLSLNECFIKAGRSENGKGNYWAIHPANLEDFSNGDFRRRRARRRVRKSNAFKFSNGLSGLPYLRGYGTPLSAYSTFYKGDDYSRLYSPGSGYSSYGRLASGTNNFIIENILAAPSSYKQFYPSGHPSLMYDQPASYVSSYPLSLNSGSQTVGTARCSAPPVLRADRPFNGPYSSSLSALASLSNTHRGNESWQDTLCKLQENLKKTSHT